MKLSQIQIKVNKFFEKLFVGTEVQYKVDFEEDLEQNHVIVQVKSTDDSLLIGYHGNNIAALQHYLRIMCHKSTPNELGPEIFVDIGTYREDRKNKTVKVAEEAVEKARLYKKTIALHPMSSYERKIVHEIVGNTEDLTSASEGEGPDRRVVISFKEQE